MKELAGLLLVVSILLCVGGGLSVLWFESTSEIPLRLAWYGIYTCMGANAVAALAIILGEWTDFWK
jgi:hypothetical protein